MGPIGSKVIEVKGQIYVFLFVPLLLPGPWADLHQTWWEGGGRPQILARGAHFLRSRSSRSKVKLLYLSSPWSDLDETW